MATSTKKKATTFNIICFGFMPWTTMWKRNQSMMAELAKQDFVNMVIFVNPHVSIRNIFKRKNRNSHISFSVSDKLFPRKRTPNLWEYTPLHFLPFKGRFPKLELMETRMMLQIIRRLNAHTPYILFMNCPNIFSQYLIDNLLKHAALSIFDFSDDFAELVCTQKGKDFFLHNITKYARAADIVLTVNEHLKNKYSFLNPNTHVIRNATNYYNFDREHYASIPSLELIKKEKGPILGYSGIANTTRIDCDLLDALLKKRPHWQYVFVGPADSAFTKKYAQYENVHILPLVPYHSLPDYIRYFDVAMVPFAINEHTRGNDLLKLHDYLAMGKPIVSTPIGGATDLKKVIRIAQGPSGFINEVESALAGNSSEEISRRKNVALRNSWHKRIDEVIELIQNSPGQGYTGPPPFLMEQTAT